MNDKQPPFEIHPDEHLEARITAYVLGEASPFEAAEIEELISKSPELKLFANRTRTLNDLLKEAETTSNSPDAEWKLSGKKRIALAPVLGPVPDPLPRRENFIRRASFRAAFGIAAVFLVTLFTKRFFFLPGELQQESANFSVAYSAVAEDRDGRIDALKEAAPPIRGAIVDELRAESKRNALERNIDANDVVDAKQDSERDITKLGELKRKLNELTESVTEEKMELTTRLPVPMAAKKPSAAPVPAEEAPDSSLAFGDGEGFGGGSGGGGSRGGSDETLAMKERISRASGADFISPRDGTTIPGIPAGDEEVSNIVTSGLRSGDAAINRNSIDAILNNPDRTAGEAKQKELSGLTGTFSDQTVDGITKALGKPSAELSAPASPKPSFAAGEKQDPGPRDPGDRPGISGKDSGELGITDGKKWKGKAQDVAKLERQLKETVHELADLQKRVDVETEALSRSGMELGGIAADRDESDPFMDEGPIKSAEVDPFQAEDSPEEINPKEAPLSKSREMADQDDPTRLNPALTREHAENVDEVRRKLYMADGNLQLGNVDDAKKAYEDALRIDPYNSVARRGMEKIANAKSDYYRAAYDTTRAELLMEVDKNWELSVPAELADKEKNGKASGYAWFSQSANKNAGDLDGRGIAGDELDADAPAISDEARFRSDLRAGAERQEADEPMSLSSLFSGNEDKELNGRAGTDSAYFFRGVDLSGADYYDRDSELDLYAENAKGPAYNDYQGGQQNGGFNGFTNFETKDSGVTLEIDPSLTDATTEFEGFIGYGSPILGLEGEAAPEPEEITVTDKLPILGDLPLIGALKRELSIIPEDAVTPESVEVITKHVEPIDLADLSQEIPAAQEPFSTFSLNVSDASFQVASSAVAKGERPDPESIKPEQFYNGVSYDDPAPSTGEPVAAAIGQVAHPVIPGRNLVRMSVRTASTGRAASQPLVLTLLVDQSGSMARADRRAAMDTALAQLATLLNPDDRITVIGFSRTPRLLADSLSGDDAGKLPDIINQASSEGGTNIEEALNLAENLALRHKLDGAQNRIVLFTDGAANLGNADPERLAGRVKKLRQQDLAFDIAGIGTNDINDQLLSELSRHGNGRYYLVGGNTGGNLAKQLAGAFRPAAENVKIQVKFNPQRVGNYKLIGFEKDRLKTEDFRNDSVDAAELAADESGTALYQVEPLPNGSGEIGELYVRFRDTATGEMVERSWTIPYESQAPAIDRAQPSMQLAALSLLAAQKLQPGPLADAINFRDLAPTIARVKQAYSRSPQAQQMVTLINALK